MICVKVVGLNGDKKKSRYITANDLPNAVTKAIELKNGKSNLPFFNKITILEVVEDNLI